MGYGLGAILGIAFQNSFHDPSSIGNAKFLEINNESVNLKKEPLISEGLRGIYDEAPTYEGKNTVEGDVEIDGKPIDLGVFLKAVLGPPTTVNSGGIYTHTFKPRTVDFDDKCAMNPFSLFKYLNVGSGDQFFDLNGNTLALSIANGEFLKATMGVVGGVWSGYVLGTSSYFSSTRIPWDVTSLSIGGTAVDYNSDLTITLDNKLEAKHTNRVSKYPAYIKRTGFRTISVNGTMRFESLDEKTAFMEQSERNLTATFDTGVEIQSGYNEKMTVILPAFRYIDFPDQAGGPTDLEVSVQAMAKYLTSSGTAMHVTLVNTQATY